MNKTLTIVIPTYNMEKYLDKCLSSLIVSDENMQRLEVLLINDGSKDSSSEIAHSYETRFPQTIRVIDKENGNYGSCVNRGLKEATGKYIKVLDADDSFDNAVFDQFISYLFGLDVDLVISDYSIVSPAGKVQSTYTFDLPINSTFSFSDMQEGAIRWLWHHGITYKTDNVRGMGYHQTEGISYTDDEWIFMPMITVKGIKYFPHSLYLYLRGREGQTFDPKVLKKTVKSRITVALNLLNYYSSEFNNQGVNIQRYWTIKLHNRVLSLYNLILIKATSKESNSTLVSFDTLLKEKAPEIFKELGNVHNKLHWHYIRIWRNSGYNFNIPILVAARLRSRMKRIIPHVAFPVMPKTYKRKQQ